MRSVSLFRLFIAVSALGGMALTGLPAEAFEIAQAGSVPARVAPDGTYPGSADWHWRLTGTVIGPEVREAVFAQGDETRTVDQGREIDGWTLSAVESGKAILTRAEQTRTVSVDGLDEVASGRAALPTAAAARAADESVKQTLAKQSSDEKAAENILHQATKAMVDQVVRRGENRE
jgi:hypothetical protein